MRLNREEAESLSKFRNQNVVLSARTCARERNVQAQAVLLTCQGADPLPHHLVVLPIFPTRRAGLAPEAWCHTGSW